MHDDLKKILFHETTILARLDELANDIRSDYAGQDLTVVALLHGSLFFMADLLRRIQLPLKIEVLKVSSYTGTASTGKVRIEDKLLPTLRGRHVLILDDILDTGLTLAAVKERLAEEQPASLRTCVLLSKRRPREKDVAADYVGFEIADEFVVGYGLDYDGHYRNLPLIGVLKEEKYQ